MLEALPKKNPVRSRKTLPGGIFWGLNERRKIAYPPILRNAKGPDGQEKLKCKPYRISYTGNQELFVWAKEVYVRSVYVAAATGLLHIRASVL